MKSPDIDSGVYSESEDSDADSPYEVNEDDDAQEKQDEVEDGDEVEEEPDELLIDGTPKTKRLLELERKLEKSNRSGGKGRRAEVSEKRGVSDPKRKRNSKYVTTCYWTTCDYIL